MPSQSCSVPWTRYSNADRRINGIFFFQAEDGIRDYKVTGVQTCALPISGQDGIFGRKYFLNISDAKDNALGLIWSDTTIQRKDEEGNVTHTVALKADKAAQDDIVETEKMMLVVNKPVKLIINSRDVIHDVGLSHFRMKMDAVPGTPTTLWFTPKFTTKEMKERENNPDFVYEISCDQMCGKGHTGMRGVIVVETQAEFDRWLAQKKP